jgi:hypothetical protein
MIRLKTAMHRFAGVTSVGDERCPTRHPLVDIEFAPGFRESACAIPNKSVELCSFVEAHERGDEFSNVEIVAEIEGHLDVYEPRREFTLDGVRFRLTIHNVLDILEVVPIHVIKP